MPVELMDQAAYDRWTTQGFKFIRIAFFDPDGQKTTNEQNLDTRVTELNRSFVERAISAKIKYLDDGRPAGYALRTFGDGENLLAALLLMAQRDVYEYTDADAILRTRKSTLFKPGPTRLAKDPWILGQGSVQILNFFENVLAGRDRLGYKAARHWIKDMESARVVRPQNIHYAAALLESVADGLALSKVTQDFPDLRDRVLTFLQRSTLPISVHLRVVLQQALVDGGEMRLPFLDATRDRVQAARRPKATTLPFCPVNPIDNAKQESLAKQGYAYLDLVHGEGPEGPFDHDPNWFKTPSGARAITEANDRLATSGATAEIFWLTNSFKARYTLGVHMSPGGVNKKMAVIALRGSGLFLQTDAKEIEDQKKIAGIVAEYPEVKIGTVNKALASLLYGTKKQIFGHVKNAMVGGPRIGYSKTLGFLKQIESFPHNGSITPPQFLVLAVEAFLEGCDPKKIRNGRIFPRVYDYATDCVRRNVDAGFSGAIVRAAEGMPLASYNRHRLGLLARLIK